MAKEQEQSGGLQMLKAEIREKKLGRLYIFYGEESFLMHHYLDQIKKLLVDDLTESFNFHKLTKETFDIRSFADAVESLPMMAEHTFVLADEIDLFKLPEADREKMGDLLGDIPEYCTVVLTYETTPWKPDKRMKKLWQVIEQNASIVEFGRQDQRQLITWVGRHFAANKKQITPELCNYLVDLTGGSMTLLSGEISKICAYSGADTVTKSDIDAVTEPVMDAVVFQMTDLLGAGSYAAALEKLHQLLKMQQEPIAILGAIGSHFRRISTARIVMDNGKGIGDLMQLLGMKEYPAQKLLTAAKRFPGSFCSKAAEWILETDRQMKTSFDEADRLLELLILRLAQEARGND